MVCRALSFCTFPRGWWGGRDFIQKLLRRGTTIDAKSAYALGTAVKSNKNCEVMVQYKVVRVLTELLKFVMRPSNQLSAVTNESRLFRPQWIVNAQLGPIFW